MTRAAKATVSVVIPTHRREHLLPAAIHSALEQTLPPLEVLVVDDAGAGAELQRVIDGAARTATELGCGTRVQLLRCDRRGPSSSRNLGAGHASGELLAFLDDDDAWAPEHLACAVSAIDDSGAALSISWLTRLDAAGEERPFKRIGEHLAVDQLMARNPGIVGSNIVIEARAFATLGGFDEQLRGSEDKDLLIRALDAGLHYCVVRQPPVRIRRHDDPRITDAQTLDAPEGVAAFYRKHAARMREDDRRAVRARIATLRARNAESSLFERARAVLWLARHGELRQLVKLLLRGR
ncbi:MAG: glycosyltransferase family 2 protein [Myxococcales bacterium]|nr:glycosyltransferase family 2 protein [Myxococcales bacterium]